MYKNKLYLSFYMNNNIYLKSLELIILVNYIYLGIKFVNNNEIDLNILNFKKKYLF